MVAHYCHASQSGLFLHHTSFQLLRRYTQEWPSINTDQWRNLWNRYGWRCCSLTSPTMTSAWCSKCTHWLHVTSKTSLVSVEEMRAAGVASFVGERSRLKDEAWRLKPSHEFTSTQTTLSQAGKLQYEALSYVWGSADDPSQATMSRSECTNIIDTRSAGCLRFSVDPLR